MSDLEPLDPELKDLFAREREAYADDVAARAAVLRRLQTAILLAPMAIGGAAAAATSTAATTGAAATGAANAAGQAGAEAAGQAGASAAGQAGATAAHAGATAAGHAGATAAGGAVLGWKGAAILAVVAFGGGVGAGEAHQALTNATPSETSRPVAVAAPSSGQSSGSSSGTASASASAASADDPVPVLAVSSLPVSPAPSAAGASLAASVAPAGSPATGDARAERVLIDTARTALARGLPDDALSATELHAKRFPRGRLAEEREAIAVQALVAKGDAALARARAERFRRAFPDSLFRATVDRAVGSLER